MSGVEEDELSNVLNSQLDRALELMKEKRLDEAEQSLFKLLANIEGPMCLALSEGSSDQQTVLKTLKARVVRGRACCLPRRLFDDGAQIGNLGNVSYRRAPPNLEQALEHYDDARRLFHELGDTQREGSICFSTANTLDRMGMPVEAIARMREFIRLATEGGAPPDRIQAAEDWITSRKVGRTRGESSGLTVGQASSAKGKTAPAPSKMQALEAAAEAADVPLSDLVGEGHVMGTSMLEYGFENLPFSDVIARSDRSLRMLDAVISMLKARALAEERYAEALVTSLAEAPSDSIVEEVTSSLWTALGSVVGSASASREAQTDDPFTVDDASDEWGGGGASGGNVSGLLAVLSLPRRWDNGSLSTTITVIERHGFAEASRRRALSRSMQASIQQLASLRQRHGHLFRDAVSASEALVKNVTLARRKLVRDHVRLAKARKGEVDSKSALERAHESFAQLLETLGGDIDSAAKSNRQFRDLQTETARRSRLLEKAVGECESAELSLQASVVEHLTARRTRDAQLAALSRKLQSAEEARMETIAGALRLVSRKWRDTQASSSESASRLERTVDRVDASSDVRMFVHKRRVARRIHEQQQELKRWETARSDSEKKRQRRLAEEAQLRKKEEEEAAQRPKDEEDASSVAAQAAALTEDGDTTLVDATLAPPPPSSSSSSSSTSWFPSLAAAPSPESTDDLEGLRDEDDEGTMVVPVSMSRERAVTFATDSMRFEADMFPIARSWVQDLFSRAVHGAVDRSMELERAEREVPAAGGGELSRFRTEEGALDDDLLAAALFDHPSGRALFLSELNWWRANGRRLHRGLPRLGLVLRRCLDGCTRSDDVAAIKMLMIMSQTFYAMQGLDQVSSGVDVPDELSDAGGDGSDGKVFASDWLRGHEAWLRQSFWEEAFYRSVREEIERPFAPFLRGGETGAFMERLVLSSSRAASGRDSAAAVPESPSASAPSAPAFQPGSTEWTYSYRQALFGQLGSYAMNMIAFGMDRSEAARVVTRLARGNGVPADMVQALLVTLEPSALKKQKSTMDVPVTTGVASAAAVVVPGDEPTSSNEEGTSVQGDEPTSANEEGTSVQGDEPTSSNEEGTSVQGDEPTSSNEESKPSGISATVDDDEEASEDDDVAYDDD
jgi:tetratricopeptide (TPR) repeat protein